MKQKFRDKVPTDPMRTKYWIDKEKKEVKALIDFGENL